MKTTAPRLPAAVWVLTAILALPLVGCGDSDETNSSQISTSEPTSGTTDDENGESTSQTPTTAPTTEPTDDGDDESTTPTPTTAPTTEPTDDGDDESTTPTPTTAPTTEPTDDGYDEGDEASVSTELDLGDDFAEDPYAEQTLGGFSVVARSDRADTSAILVTVTLTNDSGHVQQVQDFRIAVKWSPTDKNPSKPDRDSLIVEGVGSGSMDCDVQTSTWSTFTASCDIGRLKPKQQATTTMIVTGLYNIAIGFQIRTITD